MPRSVSLPARSAAFHWRLDLVAAAASVLPTLIAFNVAPSATFFNQAAAFVGWGGFLLVLGMALPRDAWPRAPAALVLVGAMALVFIATLAASAFGAVPWSLSLSSAGTMLSAVLVIAVAASAERVGMGRPAFRAFCIALAVAGVASSLIGLIQVFMPTLPDGDWIALASIPGRATGNLRQPNHLSSLLLWSIVAAVWLGEAKVVQRAVAAGLALVFIYVIVLTGSRTGALGMLTLAGWGLLDRRLARTARRVLILAPLLYLAMWWGMTLWAASSQHVFGGQTRFNASGDFSSSRFAIWSNTLALIASHPWLGVGFGDFNFAWTLTPFPGRPTEFFDHSHDLILNFAVELGVPLAALVLGLLIYALWKAAVNAVADGREDGGEGNDYPIQRAAFVIVFLVAVHSMLEYPLWYAYFLLPTAFAFGLCLERPARAASNTFVPSEASNVTRPYVLASMFLILFGTLAVYDYMRVVVIFVPPANAGPLEQRIDDGKKSVLFGHHADYAAATVAAHPGKVIGAFDRASHYLLDARLLMAWARALAERGELDKARYVAARLKEFRNAQADEFFAACGPASAASSATPPYQCQAPQRALRFEDFR